MESTSGRNSDSELTVNGVGCGELITEVGSSLELKGHSAYHHQYPTHDHENKKLLSCPLFQVAEVLLLSAIMLVLLGLYMVHLLFITSNHPGPETPDQ